MLEDIPLDRRLRLALDALGLEAPTEVQAEVVPAALAGGDLLVSAETGSGKTLAYLIPSIQRLLAGGAPPGSGTRLLVLVPTRELARQVLRECRGLLQKTPCTAAAITGGADFKYQRSLLRKNPEVLVATPGRLLEHCDRGSADLRQLQTLVLDEADRMLDLGLREEVLGIGRRCPPQRQVLMLSATLKHRGVAEVGATLLRAPRTIAVGQVRQPHSSITHQLILADSGEHKERLLGALLQQGGFRRALVFANRRDTAARLAGLLTRAGLRAGCLHGELSTEQRKQVMTQFGEGRLPILCASDVAARGLDVPEIDLVINYDMPHRGDDYLHRTGRTGRAGTPGLAISLVDPGEWNLMIGIERYLGLAFERRALPGLKARYDGPKRQKRSGKAVGAKKDRSAPGGVAAKKTRPKQRLRDRRNIGRRRAPAADRGAGEAGGNDGFAPLTRKR